MNFFSKSAELPLDPDISSKTSQIQLFYGAWVNMAHLAIGSAFGFASILIPMLSTPDSTIQITGVDASWIVSAVPLLIPLGCVISGFVMDRAGRRPTLIGSQVPMFIGWLYTALAKTAINLIIVVMLFIARAITGVGCGMAMGPSRAYVTEMALPNMRGVIGMFPDLAISLGIVVTAVLGKFLPWELVCYICCALTFVNFCSFMRLPETPYFILQTKTEEDAQANLALFRGKNYNIKKEMVQLIDFKKENNLRKLSLKESLIMLFSVASCKPFTLMMIYILIAQAVGVSIILLWTIDLLQKTKTSVDVNTGNIMIGVTRVVMGMFSALLLYRYGRKSLALLSAIGVGVVCCLFGLTLIHKDKPNLTPQIFLMVYVVFASIGYYTLPILMAFELYPLQVRGILGGATISITSLLIFATIKMESFVLHSLGVARTYLTFGLFSFIGSVFIFIWLPETKDLTLQEIEEYYKDKRPTLSSQRRLQFLHQLSEFTRPSKNIKIELERLNRESISRSNMHSQLEAQKKASLLILQDMEQLKLFSTSSSGFTSSQEREVSIDRNTKSMDVKKSEERDLESIKSGDSKKPRGITRKEENFKKDKKEIEKDTPKDEKKDKDTPEDEDQPSTSKKNTQ